MRIKNCDETTRPLLLLLSFIFYLWVASQIPYCYDDWTWGLPEGFKQFLTANLNSRYAGNFFVVIMTRSRFIKTVIMGTVFFLIPAVSSKLISHTVKDGKGKRYFALLFLAGNCLMLLIPVEIWQQTFGWVSGFANFVISALVLLMYQRVLLHLKEGNRISVLLIALIFLLGFVMQLFLENIAVYAAFVTTVLLIYILFKVKGPAAPAVSLWLGNVIGAIVMFSSGMYHTLVNTGSAIDGYRTLTFNIHDNPLKVIFGFFRRFLVLYPDRIWTDNTAVCCITCLLLSVLIISEKKRTRLLFWCPVNCFYIIYFLLVYRNGVFQFSSAWWTNIISAGIAIGYFASVLIQTLLVFNDSDLQRVAGLYFWISAPLVLLPMVVLSSVGPRSFLTSGLFLTEYALLLLLKLTENKNKCFIRGITAFSATVLCVLWVWTGIVYSDIGKVKKDRQNEIESAQKGLADLVWQKAFPHGEYLWQPDPEYEGDRIAPYRAFYRIPDDAELWFERWVDSDVDPDGNLEYSE